MLPRYSPVFFLDFHIIIFTYAEFVKLRQTGALPGPTEVAQTCLGVNRALLAQTMPVPVTTGANRDATVLHRSSTGLTPGQTGVCGGVFNPLSLSRWRHRRCGCRLGLPRYLTASLVTPVDSQLFSHPGNDVLNQFNTVHPGSPRLSTIVTSFTTVHPWSPNQEETAL